MRAIAEAQPNIALIKYWGKRDVAENLPETGSLSITLESLKTSMAVEFDQRLASDELLVNGAAAQAMLPRVSDCLDRMLGQRRSRARIASECNFPIAAGLASSAASFSALVVAASNAAGLDQSVLELARAAGAASGSAARSLYGGFVELNVDQEKISVASILDARDWPLQVVVAVTAKGEKSIGSTEAMQLCAATSPFYQSWVEQQSEDLTLARTAIAERDFSTLAEVSEHNCLKMHSVMWASRPAIVYWNKATLSCMETIRGLQADGLSVFFTIDAGPQVKAVCLPEHAEQVRAALRQIDGVIDTMQSSLGLGAHLLDSP